MFRTLHWMPACTDIPINAAADRFDKEAKNFNVENNIQTTLDDTDNLVRF